MIRGVQDSGSLKDSSSLKEEFGEGLEAGFGLVTYQSMSQSSVH